MTDGRPLPVTSVSYSPGPAYMIPSEIGTGPKVTFKQRYVADEELIPLPGPGEYEPKEGIRYNTSAKYSFGRRRAGTAAAAAAAAVAGEAGHVRPPTKEEVERAEPGPGQYANTCHSLSREPTARSGWRTSQLSESDARKYARVGKSIGAPVPKPNGAVGAGPGPGHYAPRGDHRGNGAVGSVDNPSGTCVTMRPPARASEKRADDTAAPGPGAYDTSRGDLAKQVLWRPTSLAGRPWEMEGDDFPGPGSYDSPAQPDLSRNTRKGPRFVPAPPPRADRNNGPGPGEYDISRELTPRGGGVTIKHRTGPVPRSSRCPFQKGEAVGIQVTRAGPRVRATIQEVWCCDNPDLPPAYTVVMDHPAGLRREVEGTQVAAWDGGVGPGAYDPVGGVGKWGPRHTIQGPCSFTSMAVSEARKSRDNPGPSQYYQDAKLPKSIGEGGRKVTMGNRIETRQIDSDVGPGGGPSGNYDPEHCFRPYQGYTPGVSFSGRAEVKVSVVDDPEAVRRLCEESGIQEWRGGKEWRARRLPTDGDGADVYKDDYCGMEGIFVQQGGVLRGHGQPGTGPNRPDQPRSMPYAPWAAYANKNKDTVRVKFADGRIWNYPPAALRRNRLPFDKANERWPAPQTTREGGSPTSAGQVCTAPRPAPFLMLRGDETTHGCFPQQPSLSPRITISGRLTEPAERLQGPGPGQYDLPSALNVCAMGGEIEKVGWGGEGGENRNECTQLPNTQLKPPHFFSSAEYRSCHRDRTVKGRQREATPPPLWFSISHAPTPHHTPGPRLLYLSSCAALVRCVR